MSWGRRHRYALGILVCGGGLLAIADPIRAQREAAPVPLRFQMLAAEDARPAPPQSQGSGVAGRSVDPLGPLFEGLTSLPDVQAAAVRGLGRQERPDLIPRIAPLLDATTAAVRAEAANALAQAVYGGDASQAFDRLRARIASEADPIARGVLARSIGRLPYRSAAEVDAAQAAVLALLEEPATPATRVSPGTPATRAPAVATVLGVANGFESLARLRTRIAPLGDPARARLRQLARYGLDSAGAEILTGAGREEAGRIRRLSISALTAASAMDRAVTTQGISDPDWQVRRLAIVAARHVAREPWMLDMLEKALFDAHPRVRIEALRQRAEAGGRGACQAAKATMSDEDEHVVLAAIDQAGSVCATDADAVQTLDELATLRERPTPGPRAVDWHRAAHALVSLARLAPNRTRARLGAFAGHGVWQIRMYAARAAGAAGADSTLEKLARDPDDNVCDAALTELARRSGHRADAHYLAALTRADGQVVRTAARALAGTPRREAATRALLDALARFTVDWRETTRDVRLALLDRLEETGPALASMRDELAAYVADFDPVVSERAAGLLTRWRGAPVAPQPRPLARLPLPTLERLTALRETTAVVTMARGGAWRLRLFPDEAPTNVARFTRLSGSGFFDGLTFHRVEPTFVIQGGSPHANEYAGDGPFTRDELGLRSHLRGTVGISTRGRDTGDGQIFVNLVDNVRLDHNYTIIGEVIDGMEVVDRILEGDVITRIVLERGPRRGAY